MTAAQSQPATTPREHVKMLIGGRWEASCSERRGLVYNPSTGRIIAEVPFCGAGDVDRAVQAAAAAFRDGPKHRLSNGRGSCSGSASCSWSTPRNWHIS